MTRVADPQHSDFNVVTNYRNAFDSATQASDITNAQNNVKSIAPELPLRASIFNDITSIVDEDGMQGLHQELVTDVLDEDKAKWFNAQTGQEGWVQNLISTSRGNYSSTTTYRKNSIVLYNNDGKTYIAKSDVPRGTAPTNTTYWLALSLEGQRGNPWWGVAYKGDWVQSKSYNKYDMVKYMDGRVSKFYVAMNNISSGTLITSSNWLLSIAMYESTIEQTASVVGLTGTYYVDDGNGNLLFYDAKGSSSDSLYVYTLLSNVVISGSTIPYVSNNMTMNNVLSNFSKYNNLY